MKTRIHLVVTGDAEKAALRPALERLFPGVEFTEQKVHGFTSNRLPAPIKEATKAQELVDAMLAAIDVGRTGDPANYAIALEDLELVNEDQPELVTNHVCRAVELAINPPDDLSQVAVIQKGKKRRFQQFTTPQQRRQALSTKCSFHLVAPMLEAWFFGERAALTRAGVPADKNIFFDKNKRDIEDFETNDKDYLGPNVNAYYWACDFKSRGRHPKNYIRFLRDPEGIARGSKRYRESRDAVVALEDLDWAEVVSPKTMARMVAALLDDLSKMVGRQLNFDLGEPHPLLSVKRGGCLRNIKYVEEAHPVICSAANSDR